MVEKITRLQNNIAAITMENVPEDMPVPRERAPLKERPGKRLVEFVIEDLIKDRGVPQGAPTSCSLATLVLRILKDLDVVIYADDLIYFPKSSDCDPVRDLSNSEFGLIVNKGKSRWVKKDGV